MSHHCVAAFLLGVPFGICVLALFLIMCSFFVGSFDSGRVAEISTSSWVATSTTSTPPCVQVLQACRSLWNQYSHTFVILLSIAFLIVVVALILYYLARWVLKALRLYFKTLLYTACVTTLGWCASAWPASTIFKGSAFLVSAYAFLGLIWWVLDILWLLFHGWATSSTPEYVAPTTTTRITFSTATASNPPAPPTPPMPTQEAHTFWGEFTPTARSVIALVSPVFALFAFFVGGVVSATGLLGAVHHAWTLLMTGFAALGAKILKEIQHIFAVLRAGMAIMTTGSKTIIIVRRYGRRSTLEMVTKKQHSSKSFPACIQKARKRQRAARRRALLASLSTTADVITHTEAEEISQPIHATTATTAGTTKVNIDMLATASKIIRCSSDPDLRTFSGSSTVGLSFMAQMPTTTINSSSGSSSSSSSSSITATTATMTTNATPPTTEAERERSKTSNRVARASVLEPAYDVEEDESKRNDNISSSLPVCPPLVCPAVAHQHPKSKMNKLALRIKKVFTRTPKPEEIIAQIGDLDFDAVYCETPLRKGFPFKKVFERKLSTSSSSTSSSSSTDSRRSSMSFSAGLFAADGECFH